VRAVGGVSFTVFAITLRRVSRGSGGTREGRVLSRFRPSTPSSRYRACQRQTVGFDVLARRMISLVPQWSADANMIPARQTTFRGVLGQSAALPAALGRRGQDKGRCHRVSCPNNDTYHRKRESSVR
jgi:hypothetical protein